MMQPSAAAAPGSDFAQHWSLDPSVVFLNHGSFGACPSKVLQYQQALRDRMEREPVRFLAYEAEPLLDKARGDLAGFLGADPEDLVFVPNVTAGFNTVIRSLSFEVGDELLTTAHLYNACRNVLNYTAQKYGVRVVVAEVPFPLFSRDSLIDAVLSKVTERTKLAALDHVTSPTGLIFPIERLVAELDQRGIDTLVDGAHAPGMVDLDLSKLGAAYYTGNCHKWLCAPKGAGFLHVRKNRQALIRPLVISHGANSTRTDISLFQLEFLWPGTIDPTPYLCIPEAIRLMGTMLPNGWPALRARNRELALAARRLLCSVLGAPPPAPEEMIGSLATVPLPDDLSSGAAQGTGDDPLYTALLQKYRIQARVLPWPEPPQRVLRISAQLYNSIEQFELLAHAVKQLLQR
jgi:isopenicillin-N epimerase